MKKVLSFGSGWFIGFLVLCGPMVFAAEQLPFWTLGSTFTSTLEFHLAGDYAGGTFDLTFQAPAFELSLDETGSKTLTHGNEGTYSCYVLNFAGAVSASGQVDIWEPLVFNAPVELRTATLSGNYWVTTDELATARRLLVISGEVWAYFFEHWQDIGTFQCTLAHEFDAPQKDFEFPLDLSNHWSQNVANYVFGDVAIEVSIFGEPYSLNQHVETSKDINFTSNVTIKETVNSCSSYKVNAADSPAGTTQNAWYCPDFQWYSRMDLDSLQLSTEGGSNDFRMLNYHVEITGAHAQPTSVPSPTPIPSPTATPIFTLGVALEMPSDFITTGDDFYLTAIVSNPGPPLFTYPLLVVLQYLDGYWFWPHWYYYPPDIDQKWIDVPIGSQTISIIDPLVWPDVGGPVNGIYFYGALLNQQMTDVVGELATVQWGYGS